MNNEYQILCGDALAKLRTLPDESVQMCATSPPYYGLRNYSVEGQIGLESTPQSYVARLVEVFREVRRVLKKDGTAWVNLGDSYNNRTKVRTSSHQPALNGYVDDNWAERAAKGGVRMSHGLDGIKEKDLIGIPWRVAFALQADGWWLRQDIIWSKPNPMPESVTDRCTKSHEYIFLLSKSAKYYFDNEAIAEPSIHFGQDARSGVGNIQYLDGKRNGENGNGQHSFVTINETKNKRSVWTVRTQAYSDAHFATFPPELVEPMIFAGSREGDIVLDPFSGAATTGLVALQHRRRYIGVELNADYIEISKRRLAEVQVRLF